jgi:hypothetical protein
MKNLKEVLANESKRVKKGIKGKNFLTPVNRRVNVPSVTRAVKNLTTKGF